ITLQLSRPRLIGGGEVAGDQILSDEHRADQSKPDQQNRPCAASLSFDASPVRRHGNLPSFYNPWLRTVAEQSFAGWVRSHWRSQVWEEFTNNPTLAVLLSSRDVDVFVPRRGSCCRGRRRSGAPPPRTAATACQHACEMGKTGHAASQDGRDCRRQ